MIGSLLYPPASRSDIVSSVGVCARCQSCPKVLHLNAIKRILKYLKGTIELGLWYTQKYKFWLFGYYDANFAGCILNEKVQVILITF